MPAQTKGTPMLLRYVAKRLIVGAFQLIGLTIAVFFIIRLLPADPVSRLVGMNASAEAYDQAAAQLGVDRPILEQLSIYLGFKPEIEPGGFVHRVLRLDRVLDLPDQELDALQRVGVVEFDCKFMVR